MKISVHASKDRLGAAVAVAAGEAICEALREHPPCAMHLDAPAAALLQPVDIEECQRPAGFVDLQVNGFHGVDFSSRELTAAQIDTLSKTLAEAGTLAYCPTIVTCSLESYEHVLPLLARQMHEQKSGARILGIHLEGPFINPSDGARGAHDRRYVRPPEKDFLRHLWELSDGTLRLLTLAPELPGSVELIEYATGLGITVSAGHTLCDTDDLSAAQQAGLHLSTHLGNGCPNQLDRHRNPIWAQLASGLQTMLITDGHHLPPELIQVFIRAKGAGNIIVTSDASPVGGLPEGEYDCFGSRVRVCANGRVESCSGANLAGSGATLLECLNHLAAIGYAEEDLLWQFGYYNPLAAIGITPEELAKLTAQRPRLVRWQDERFVAI